LTGLHAGEAAYGTIVDTKKRLNSRPSWVWAALALQFVLLSLTAYGCVQVLALWSRYAASGMGAQLAVRVFFPAAMVAVSLIGLWRTRRWGWILAFVADGALCAQTLWFLLDYARAIRNARWLAFNIWEFAALAVLIYRPVRDHFLQRNRVPRKATTPLVPPTTILVRVVPQRRSTLRYHVKAMQLLALESRISTTAYKDESSNPICAGSFPFLYFAIKQESATQKIEPPSTVHQVAQPRDSVLGASRC